MTRESPDRFKSVESLASQIFNKLPELQDSRQDGGSPEQPHPSDISNVIPFLQGDLREKSAVLSLTERFLSTLLAAMEERTQAETPSTESARLNRPPEMRNDVGYRSAYKRAQLPDGVEPLRGEASGASDDVMMTSIRQMMEEQEKSFRETRVAEKRAFNRQVLPPLEPAEDFEAEDDEDAFVDAEVRRGLRARLLRRLQKASRNYYLLAISLSGWSTLSMMVLIDPAVSTALCFTSLLLLVIAYFMFMERIEEQRGLRSVRVQNR